MQGLEYYLALAACIIPAIYVVRTIVDSFCGRGALGINMDATSCAMCVAALPSIRLPRSLRQAALGGWTCRECGTENDRHGRVHMQRRAS